MRNLYILVILSMVIMASKCKKPLGAEDFGKVFWVQNNSHGNIWYIIGKSYPDTFIPNQESEFLRLEPSEKKDYTQREGEWEDFFSALPADTLSIFFFSGDSAAKYGFHQIRTNYNILERRDFGLQYLKVNTYTISYP